MLLACQIFDGAPAARGCGKGLRCSSAQLTPTNMSSRRGLAYCVDIRRAGDSSADSLRIVLDAFNRRCEDVLQLTTDDQPTAAAGQLDRILPLPSSVRVQASSTLMRASLLLRANQTL